MALKVGVVGMGGIGHTHCRCYKNDSLAELIAVCDIIKEKLTRRLRNSELRLFTHSRKCLRRIPNSI